ncbi:MAG: NAD(P)H-binding protein [Alphaproteobacteria bacterium]|nr:NAD(P)H-binding protein [Alphaproteobacteria bacterium]
MRPVMIFGASRGVGLALARLLRVGNVPVLAMLRSQAESSGLESLGVRIVRGDAFSRSDVAHAFAHLPAGGDVVSTLGGRADDGRYVDHEGNVNVIERAATHPVERFVLVTSIGCGEMAPFRSERAIAAFGEAVDAKTRAEDHLKRTIPSATIVRPGGLRSAPATGRGVLIADPEAHGFVNRGDVAELVARALRDSGTTGRAFAAVDAEMARTTNAVAPFPLRPLSDGPSA